MLHILIVQKGLVEVLEDAAGGPVIRRPLPLPHSQVVTHTQKLSYSADTPTLPAGQAKGNGALRTPDGATVTVNDIHTYYVLAGETPVLVHNAKRFCEPDADALQEWDQATFGSLEETATYHLNKHGKGRTLAEYTQAARDLWNKTDAKDRVAWKLRNGDMGWKIRGGLLGGEGIYTESGKIVTWHD